MDQHPNHRQSIRIPHFDHSQPGWYFVTVCTKDRKEHFGAVKNEEMELNRIGNIVKDEWLRTPIIRKNIALDEWLLCQTMFTGLWLFKIMT